MNANRTLVVAVAASFAAAFTTGCAVAPPAQPPHVKPVVEIRHSGLQADGYYQLGRFLQAQSRHQEAEEAYLKALALDPLNVDAHNGLGTLHALNGRYEDAHRSFNAALAIAPNSGAVLNNVGYAYLLERRSDKAADAFRRAVVVEPGNARYRANLQTALKGGGAPASAPALADAASAVRPAVPDVERATPPAAETEAPVAKLVPAGPYAFELVMPAARETKPAVVLASGPDAGRVSLEVSNANGAEGMARRVAGQLSGAGQPVKRLTNQMPFGRVATHIQYRPGNKQAALALSRRVPGSPPVMESTTLRTGVDVRLVLGNDLPTNVALLSTPEQVASASR